MKLTLFDLFENELKNYKTIFDKCTTITTQITQTVIHLPTRRSLPSLVGAVGWFELECLVADEIAICFQMTIYSSDSEHLIGIDLIRFDLLFSDGVCCRGLL